MKTNDDALPAASPAPPRRTMAAARKLRRISTEVERELWHRIRDKQIDNFRFRRQRPIGKYIVDFICLDAKLIVELDGGQHAENVEYDEMRTAFLESLGHRVLRFWNNEVLENLDGVLERLREELLHARANPTPALPCRARGPLHRATVPQAHRARRETPASPLAGEGADSPSDDGSTIANAPSPATRGVERGIRDACITPAERLDDAAASAPCKGVGMGVPRKKATATKVEEGLKK